MDTEERDKMLAAASGQVQREILRQQLVIEKKGEAIRLRGGQINILVVSLALIRLDDLGIKS